MHFLDSDSPAYDSMAVPGELPAAYTYIESYIVSMALRCIFSKYKNP